VTALAQALTPRSRIQSRLTIQVVSVVLGSMLMAALAQVSVKLPFTPVPVTGQTLGVLLVGGALGSVMGVASMLLYLAQGAVGLPFFADGGSGTDALGLASATGGYLWGFVVAGYVVGLLAERKWDRGIGSSLGAMLIGEVIIFSIGVTWLAQALDLPLQDALEAGLYPFVVGDVLKLAIAAGTLPIVWRFIDQHRPGKGEKGESG
jgi:biotin transport system substrate-specific component